jgi:hypothetical protein
VYPALFSFYALFGLIDVGASVPLVSRHPSRCRTSEALAPTLNPCILIAPCLCLRKILSAAFATGP